MSWLIVLVVILALGVLGFSYVRGVGKKALPKAVYVCDLCGERDCICHKEDPSDQSGP